MKKTDILKLGRAYAKRNLKIMDEAQIKIIAKSYMAGFKRGETNKKVVDKKDPVVLYSIF